MVRFLYFDSSNCFWFHFNDVKLGAEQKMRKTPYIVGVYHRDESHRKAALCVLGKEFECKEIEDWDMVDDTSVDTMVIISPELLYPERSFESMIDRIQNLPTNVIMVNHDDSIWWVFRLGFTQLKNPSNELLMACIKAYRFTKRSIGMGKAGR